MSAVIVYDRAGKLLDADSEAKRLLDIADERGRESWIYDRIGLDDLPELVARNLRLFGGGQDKEPVEFSIRGRRGEPVRVEARGRILYRSGAPHAIEDRLQPVLDRDRVGRVIEEALEHKHTDISFLKRLRRALLPDTLPAIDNTILHAASLPDQAPGRDFLHIQPLGAGALALALGDVVGPTPLARLLAPAIAFQLAQLEQDSLSPRTMLDAIDQTVAGFGTEVRIRALCALWDSSAPRLDYILRNAPPPFTPGRAPDHGDEDRGTLVPVSGQKIFFTSWGAFEALSQGGEKISPQQAAKAFHGFSSTGDPKTDFDCTIRALRKHVSATLDSIDLTLVSLDYRLPVRDKLRFPSSIGAVDPRVASIIANLTGFGYPEDVTSNIRLCTQELLLNAAEHGNNCDPDKEVECEYEISTKRFMARVADQGAGFCPDALPDPTTEEHIEKVMSGERPPRGWGVFLVRSHCDHCRYNEPGNEVVVSIANPPSRIVAHGDELGDEDGYERRRGAVKLRDTGEQSRIKIDMGGALSFDHALLLGKCLEGLDRVGRVDICLDNDARVSNRVWAVLLKTQLELDRTGGALALHLSRSNPTAAYLRRMGFDKLLKVDFSD